LFRNLTSTLTRHNLHSRDDEKLTSVTFFYAYMVLAVRSDHKAV